MTDEQLADEAIVAADAPWLAIWRRLAPEQRQRVIDATWMPAVGPYGDNVWVAYSEPQREDCCPLGVALPERGWDHPAAEEVEAALALSIDLGSLDVQADGDMSAFDRLYVAECERFRAEAEDFIVCWDRGEIPITYLLAALRQMQAA